jgi:hypothetical protein
MQRSDYHWTRYERWHRNSPVTRKTKKYLYERLRLFLRTRVRGDMVVTRTSDIYLTKRHEGFACEADLTEALPDTEELMAKAEFEAEQDLQIDELEEQDEHMLEKDEDEYEEHNKMFEDEGEMYEDEGKMSEDEDEIAELLSRMSGEESNVS